MGSKTACGLGISRAWQQQVMEGIALQREDLLVRGKARLLARWRGWDFVHDLKKGV